MIAEVPAFPGQIALALLVDSGALCGVLKHFSDLFLADAGKPTEKL